MTRRIAWVAALLVVAWVSSSSGEEDESIWAGFEVDEGGEETVRWLRELGGKAALKVGKRCEGCVRGAFASRALEVGEAVLSVPLKACIDLSGTCPDGGICGLVRRLWSADDQLHISPEHIHTYVRDTGSDDARGGFRVDLWVGGGWGVYAPAGSCHVKWGDWLVWTSLSQHGPRRCGAVPAER